MGAGCAPLVAGLFLLGEGALWCLFLVVGGLVLLILLALTSRYLDGVLGIGGVCFGSVVGQVFLWGLQLNEADTSEAEAAFLDLRLSISNDIVSTGICDKRDGFCFGVVGFPFLDGGVPRSASCGNRVSRLVRFVVASGCVTDFNSRN